jgi:hypothetical protein
MFALSEETNKGSADQVLSLSDRTVQGSFGKSGNNITATRKRGTHSSTCDLLVTCRYQWAPLVITVTKHFLEGYWDRYTYLRACKQCSQTSAQFFHPVYRWQPPTPKSSLDIIAIDLRLFRFVSFCFILFHFVSPCFVLFDFVSPCFLLFI